MQAYALVPAPTIALFEARALVQLKRLVEARGAYVRASSATLSNEAPAAHRDAVRDAEAELAEVERRIPRFRVIESGLGRESAAGVVSIDGRSLSRSAFGSWLRTDPGSHELRFTDESGASSIRLFELREGDAKTLRIDAGSRSTGARRVLGIVSLGVGAAGLGLGVSAGLVAVDAHRDARRRCPAGTCVPGSTGAAALERFERYRTASTIGYAVGAAGGVAGAVLLLSSSSPSRPRLAVAAGFHDVRLEGTF